MKRNFKPIFIMLDSHCLQSRRHTFRIAVLTTLTDLGAARYRVPGHLCPFDFANGCHLARSSSRVTVINMKMRSVFYEGWERSSPLFHHVTIKTHRRLISVFHAAKTTECNFVL